MRAGDPAPAAAAAPRPRKPLAGTASAAPPASRSGRSCGGGSAATERRAGQRPHGDGGLLTPACRRNHHDRPSAFSHLIRQ